MDLFILIFYFVSLKNIYWDGSSFEDGGSFPTDGGGFLPRPTIIETSNGELFFSETDHNRGFQQSSGHHIHPSKHSVQIIVFYDIDIVSKDNFHYVFGMHLIFKI